MNDKHPSLALSGFMSYRDETPRALGVARLLHVRACVFRQPLQRAVFVYVAVDHSAFRDGAAGWPLRADESRSQEVPFGVPISA